MLLQLASLFIAIVSVLNVQGLVPIAELGHNAPQLPLDSQPQLSARSAFLIDTQSGRILFERAPDEKRPIASITKLMTALAVLDAPTPALSPREMGIDGWNQYVTFEAQDRRNGGISYLIPGEEITMRDAWNLMLVGSSNDASAMLARVTAGSEAAFVETMNQKARALGLKHTVFVDPTGLHVENVSTAREVAAFTRFALAYPEIRDALEIRQFQFAPQGRASRTVRSTNWLVGAAVAGARAFGGKTGHIEASGYNFASAQGDGTRELVGVVLGATSNEARFTEMRELLAWGFNVVQE